MKKSILYISAFILSIAFISACDEDDLTGHSGLKASSPSASVSLDFDNNLTTVESNQTYTYTVNLSTPQIADIYIPVTLVGGTATEHADFDFDHQLFLEAFKTSVTGTITTYEDTEIEGTEDFTLKIGGDIVNGTMTSQNVTFNLTNFVADYIDMTFSWDKNITIDGTDYSTCDYVDLDIFVSDAEGFDINDPWATWNGTDYAATGDCPEHLIMNIADWGDGEYVIWHENWYNSFAGEGLNTLIPISATIVRPGAFSQVVTQDDSQALNSDNEGEDQDNPTMTHGFIVKVKIENGVFTIYDYSNTQVASGRIAENKKTPRPILNLRK